jgi:hypothetical protein
MSVLERLARLRHAIIPRNIHELSEKVHSPSVGDVNSPHHDTPEWKAEQHRHVLQAHCHLADRQVERVRHWSPPAQKRCDKRWVILVMRCLQGTWACSLFPSTNRARGSSPAARSLKHKNQQNTIYLIQIRLKTKISNLKNDLRT